MYIRIFFLKKKGTHHKTSEKEKNSEKELLIKKVLM